MKIARVRWKGSEVYGFVDGERLIMAQGDPFCGLTPTGEELPLEEVKLLPPVSPSKIVALGLNYRDHAEEVGLKLPSEPLIFLKPSTAVIGPGDAILYPPSSKRLDYEGELAVVISKRAKDISLEEAPGYILGYTCFNDVTARDLQYKDKQWTRAKGFDTFAPLGPWIETELDPRDLLLETYLNGELRQSTRTSWLVFDPYYLVSFISQVMTLLPGDVIATGTPSGIGPMEVGDQVEVRIEGIGSLLNHVEAYRPLKD